MEKSIKIPGSVNPLIPTIARAWARLANKLMPRWTRNRIETMLFVPKARNDKPLRLPRGFQQFEIRTGDGVLNAYASGNGPTVVFVHGWGGGAGQFFPLMHGLAQCGFRSIAFDHLGHGHSDQKAATLQQSIATTNQVLKQVKNHSDGLCAIVAHSTGCIAVAAARNALIKDVPLFLVSPVFNYRLYFLKKLATLKLHPDLVRQYAARFAASYQAEYRKYELGTNLARYGDVTVIAHDESDVESPISDSRRFCAKYPLTRLLVTRNLDHCRIISSESVWKELKSHLNYDDSTINFSAGPVYQ